MRFKLHENIGTRGAERLRAAGHVVIPLSKPATLAEIELGIDTPIRGARLGPLEGKLRIVDRGMIREYQPPE